MNYLCLGLMLLLLACQQEQKVTSLPDKEVESVYRLCKATALPQGIGLQVRLDTATHEQLLLKVHIRNTSQRALQLNLYEITLLSQDLRRQAPVAVSPEDEMLAAGEEREYRWSFRPVNDMYLYQRSGLPGSWLQEYRLPLSFIQGVQDTLSFCFQESAYIQYSKRAAKNQPVLYVPLDKRISRQAAARQEQYWASISGHLKDAPAASAYFSEQEFFSAGVNLRHALYHRGDSLYLRLQLVNHAPYILMVTPAEMVASAAGRTHIPVGAYIQGHAKATEAMLAKPYAVRKGDRLSITLTYPLPAAESVKVSFQGLQVAELQEPLFAEEVLYRRQ
jgi:hypothetical protein